MSWLTSEADFLRRRSGAELSLAVALGTFHATALLLALVMLQFRRDSLGDTLDGLATGLGFGLFLLLWLTTTYCTLKGIADVGLSLRGGMPAGKMLVAGLAWGAANGMLFLLALLVAGLIPFAVVSIVTLQPEALAAIVVLFGAVAFFGGLVAGFIGALAGLVFALIDVSILSVAVRLAGIDPGPDADMPAGPAP